MFTVNAIRCLIVCKLLIKIVNEITLEKNDRTNAKR